MGAVTQLVRKPKIAAQLAPKPAPSAPEISQSTSTESTIDRGRGRSSMILTGPQGLGSGDLKLRKKTLLG